MAEEALKRLEEQLNCSICLDTYTNPKILQCFHVYCRRCLVPLVVRDQQGQLGLTCPTCRQVTPVPDRGVAGIQPAFHINNLQQIRDSLQTLENLENQEEAATGADSVVHNSSCAILRSCIEHPEEELKLYCETCGELVCLQCIMKDRKHHDHEYALLANAFEKYKEEITSLLAPTDKKIATLKKALVLLEKCREEVLDLQAVTKDSIHITFMQLQEVLTERENELSSHLDQMTEGKLKGLAVQRDQIETNLAQLSNGLHFMRESIHTLNKEDALMMKTKTVRKVEELKAPLQVDLLEPNAEANLAFSASSSADLTALCQEYGQIFIQGLPDPLKCHATGKGVDAAAVVGEKSTALLQVNNIKGKPCEGPVKSLECEFVSEITGTRASCSVQRGGQSQYEISYQPTVKGRHQLHIRAEGQHIRESPFSVAVTSSIGSLGTPIKTIEGVRGPLGVAINHIEEVIVTEWGKDCVTQFSHSGRNIRSFGKYGLDNGQFQGPRGVAVDGEGNILVTDGGNSRIQKFTSEGQFLRAVGSKGKGPLTFAFPSGIAVNGDLKKIYVGDQNNNCVQVLNSDLTFSSTFGKEGGSKGEFHSPHGIACDITGKVYVADTDNYRIQVFTAEGDFCWMFGRRGQGRGELDRPIGVAIDTSGMVYVSECGNDRVSVFTSVGHFVTSFERRGKDNMQPRGLTVDSLGVVYVCDYYNHCLQMF